MNDRFSWELFERMPLIGIMRNMPEAVIDTIAHYYAEAGLTNLEITMNSEGAVGTIALLVRNYGRNMNIGAGTVLTLDDLDQALSAGARFIVTPVVNEDVILACAGKNIPVFPGAYTPTEIYKAWKMGAGMVKVFPAGKLGVDYIREVLAPMNYLKLLPTGGITLHNYMEYLRAGAAGVGLGSNLFPKDIIRDKNWDELRKTFDRFVSAFQR